MHSKLFLAFALCIGLFACNTDRRTPFKISGEVKGINGTRVSLQQFGIVYDNAVVANDTFSLAGNLTSMEMCEVVFKGDNYKTERGNVTKWGRDLAVFVDVGASYKLIANSDDDLLRNKYKVESSSVHQNTYFNYINQERKLRDSLQAKLNEVDVKLSASLGNDKLYEVYLDSFRIYEDKLKRTQHVTYRKMLAENPNTYAAIYIASTAYDIQSDLPFYVGFYNRLDKEFKNHAYRKS